MATKVSKAKEQKVKNAKEAAIPRMIIKDTDKPLSVVVDKTLQPPAHIITKEENKTLAPNTTEEDDRQTLGQRNINLIWETTQAKIATFAVFVGISVNVVIPIMMVFIGGEVNVARIAVVSSCLSTISTTVGIIIGFYFSRTNHSATGGTGAKPKKKMTGNEDQER